MSATLNERYQLERELARGAMGVVWVARDTQLQRRVAVKLMYGLGLESPELRQMFKHEAQIAAQLQHPNVVEIYDYGVTGEGHPYIVMELLEGETLAERMERAHTMTPAAFVPIFVQIAKALEAAHARVMVHRDLKPQNIFLCRHGSDTVVKVLDFGVALMQTELPVSDTVSTSSGSIVGTPPYMGPEQITGQDIDHRADLWALGVIAYQALTGQLPFVADNLSTLALRVCGQPLTPPSSRVPSSTPAIDAFFVRALAKDPAERYASASDMAQALAAALPGEEVTRTKILAVDDEPDLPLVLEQCFDVQIEDGIYEFVFAGNGQEGLERLREHPDIDIVLTDLRMPVMDGLTFLGKLGELAPTARAVVMSAFGDMDNIRKAMNQGAFDFLTKPIDFESLEATIDKAAQDARRLRRALQSMEENAALRMFIDPATLDRLLPVLRVAGSVVGEAEDATVVIVRACIQPGEAASGASADNARALVERVNRTYDALMRVLDEHSGRVVRFFGDTLLAVFSGEDHGLRALSASAVAGALAAPLSCAVGVAGGTVIAGNVGAPGRHRFDYAVFGAPVERAFALARVAEPGQVLVTEPLIPAADIGLSYSPVAGPGPIVAGQKLPVVILSARTDSEPSTASLSRGATIILDDNSWTR